MNAGSLDPVASIVTIVLTMMWAHTATALTLSTSQGTS